MMTMTGVVENHMAMRSGLTLQPNSRSVSERSGTRAGVRERARAWCTGKGGGVGEFRSVRYTRVDVVVGGGDASEGEHAARA
jgi:hypothetical protein